MPKEINSRMKGFQDKINTIKEDMDNIMMDPERWKDEGIRWKYFQGVLNVQNSPVKDSNMLPLHTAET